jgi:SAM-dependent methyltransferase
MSDPPYTRSASVYDVVYAGDYPYSDAALSVHGLIQARHPGARTVLEAACGTGLFAVEMSRWYEVSGLDAASDMLAECARRLPDMKLHEGDMAHFTLGRSFDAVICMFSSIGYVVSPDRLRSALQSFAAHLVPGGVVVVEPWIYPEGWIDNHTTVDSWRSEGMDVARVISSERDGRKVTMRWGFAVARPGGEVDAFVENHPTGLFDHQEYLTAFAEAGLRVDHDPQGPIGRGLYVGVKPFVV